MNQQPEQADVDRRTILLLGLAGASTLILGAGDRGLAGEATGMDIAWISR